jgi:hypothetical protein
MSTATLTKKTDTILADTKARFEAFEEIVRSHIANDEGIHSLTSGELLLASTIGLDKEGIRREFSRIGLIVSYQTTAGSAADRKAARDRLSNAQKLQQTKGSALREQLAEVTERLQREITEIDRSVSEAGSEVMTRENAVKALQGVAPEQTKREAEHAVSVATLNYVARMNEVQTEISRCEAISRLENANHFEKLEFCRRLPDSRRFMIDRDSIRHAELAALITESREKIPSLTAEYRELAANKKDVIESVQAEALSLYVPK